MNQNNTMANVASAAHLRQVYFLTQILDKKVLWHGKKIGRLADVVISENSNSKLPEVTHFVVARPFGYPPLWVPLSKVNSMSAKRILMEAENLLVFEAQPKPDVVLLKDHILDKKVLDIEDREVEVVYDVKMTLMNGHLYVTDADLSKYGLLRRMGFKWLADLIYRPKERPNQEIISWTYIQPLPSDIGSFQGNVKLNILKERLHEIDAVDLADIIEELDPGQRAVLFGELDIGHASDTLEEIDPNVQRELVASLKKERVAQLINEMTPAQAADVLAALPADQVDGLLPLMNKVKVKKIQSIINQQETRIMDFATSDFLQYGPEITVAQVEEEFPKVSKGKDVITYIYVANQDGKLLGVVDLKNLLLADDELQLKDIMDDNIINISPDDTLRQTAKMFRRYNFQALPITNEEGKILGVIPHRDIMRLKHKFLV